MRAKKKKKFCVVCGEASLGDFCCKAHELLHFDEEELSRNEEINTEEESTELEELKREEMRSDALRGIDG